MIGVLLFILFVTPIVLLFTLSTLLAEPRVGKVQTKAGRSLEEPQEWKAHLFSAGWHASQDTASLPPDAAAVAAATT